MLVLILILNFVISWFNAWAVGKSWPETKHVGGFAHFLNWMGAVMSACGFTSVYVVLAALGIQYFHWLPDKYVSGILSLGYLIIIIPVLGSGLALTVNSWMHFWRNKNLGSGAVAGWNTFAQIKNTIDAMSAIPQALSGVFDMFKSDTDRDEEAPAALLVMLAIIVVVVAVAGGILTTSTILRRSARAHMRQLEIDFEEIWDKRGRKVYA